MSCRMNSGEATPSDKSGFFLMGVLTAIRAYVFCALYASQV